MPIDTREKLFWRYLKAYLSVGAMVGVVVGISEAKGAGWRPALAGMPMYITLLLLVTYQLIKDIRTSKRTGADESSAGSIEKKNSCNVVDELGLGSFPVGWIANDHQRY